METNRVNAEVTEKIKSEIIIESEKVLEEAATEDDHSSCTGHESSKEISEEAEKSKGVKDTEESPEQIDVESKDEAMESLDVLKSDIGVLSLEKSPTDDNTDMSPGQRLPVEGFLTEKANNKEDGNKRRESVPRRKIELDQISNDSAFENRELIQKFHGKMYRISKVFVYAHILLSTCGAIGYSVVAISSTNEWHEGIETPGWHIPGGFIANVVMINTLAVAVNLNLCFAALLIIGFYKHNRLLIWMWYLGQLGMETVVTCTLVLSVFYDCKLAAMLSIPPFLYYVISLSSFRQILATVSLNKSIQV